MPAKQTIQVEVTVDSNGAVTGMKLFDKTLEDTSKKLPDTSKKTRDLADSLGGRFLIGAVERAGQMVTSFAAQLPAMAVELVKTGVAVQRQTAALDNLAMEAGTSSGEIVEAIQTASGFTIDKMTAMGAANKAMLLSVAKTPTEFERMTKVATALGRAMGQDAAKSIDDFVTAAGRQSMQIADNLGLTIKTEQAQENYAKSIGKTAAQLTDAEKKQAFLNEMLVAGEAKLATLGGVTDDAAAKMERMDAGWKDAKASIGSLLATLVDASGVLDAAGGWARDTAAAADAVEKHGFSIQAWAKAYEVFMKSGFDRTKAIETFNAAIEEETQTAKKNQLVTEDLRYANIQAAYAKKKGIEAAQDLVMALENEADAAKASTVTVGGYWKAVSKVSYVTDEAKASIKAQVPAQWELEKAVLDTIKALEEEAQTMRDMSGLSLDLSMQFTQFSRDTEQTAADHVASLEELEAEHQSNLLEIQQRGMATRQAVDVEGETQKLELLKAKLELALTQQSEFGDKTTQAARLAKQMQIDELKAQIGEQTTLLQDASNGYRTIQGADITLDLENERTRYAERKKILEEQRALELAEQRRHLGEMILQSFDAWVAIHGGVTEKTLLMRTKLAEEYGLVEKGSAEFVGSMIETFDKWGEGSITNTGNVIAQLDRAAERAFNLKDAIEQLPTSKDIAINYTINVHGQPPEGESHPEYTGGAAPSDTGYGGATPGADGYQHGGQFMVGPGYGGPQMFLAGEGKRPEVVTVQNIQNRNVDMGGQTINNGMDAAMLNVMVQQAMLAQFS